MVTARPPALAGGPQAARAQAPTVAPSYASLPSMSCANVGGSSVDPSSVSVVVRTSTYGMSSSGGSVMHRLSVVVGAGHGSSAPLGTSPQRTLMPDTSSLAFPSA